MEEEKSLLEGEKEKKEVEKIEPLLQELLEEKEEVEKEKKEEQLKRKKDFLWILLGFLLVFSLISSLYVLYTLLQKKDLPLSQKLEEKPKEEKKAPLEEKKEVASSNETVEKEKIIVGVSPVKKEYPYKLVLKDFLYPLNERVFVKIDFHLYFEEGQEYKRAIEEELLLRKLLLDEIRKMDPSLWREEKKLKEFEEELKKLLQEKPLNLKVDKVEIEGIYLKA